MVGNPVGGLSPPHWLRVVATAHAWQPATRGSSGKLLRGNYTGNRPSRIWVYPGRVLKGCPSEIGLAGVDESFVHGWIETRHSVELARLLEVCNCLLSITCLLMISGRSSTRRLHVDRGLALAAAILAIGRTSSRWPRASRRVFKMCRGSTPARIGLKSRAFLQPCCSRVF